MTAFVFNFWQPEKSSFSPQWLEIMQWCNLLWAHSSILLCTGWVLWVLTFKLFSSEKWSWIILLIITSPPFSLFSFFGNPIIQKIELQGSCDMFPWCSNHFYFLSFLLADFWILFLILLNEFFISDIILWLFQELFIILWAFFVGVPHSLFHGYILFSSPYRC